MTTTVPPDRAIAIALGAPLTAADFDGGPTLVVRPDAFEVALTCARGHYQRALLHGWQTWSGADLTGAASRYRGRYATSRDNLLRRMTRAGVPWAEVRVGHGRRRCVVLGLDEQALRPVHPDFVVRS